jgi:hypothetical protein
MIKVASFSEAVKHFVIDGLFGQNDTRDIKFGHNADLVLGCAWVYQTPKSEIVFMSAQGQDNKYTPAIPGQLLILSKHDDAEATEVIDAVSKLPQVNVVRFFAHPSALLEVQFARVGFKKEEHVISFTFEMQSRLEKCMRENLHFTETKANIPDLFTIRERGYAFYRE